MSTAIELVPEFSYRATLKAPVDFGAGPRGVRMYYEVTGGEVSGERLSGTIGTGGGDWLLIGPDGLARIDVRFQFETHDGAAIYVHYEGVLELNDAVQRAMATGAGTEVADQYFRTTPYLETGDERYAWVNRSVFVAQGRLVPGGVEYFVARVA